MARVDRWIERFNAWWFAPGPGTYGPGIFDFEPDWSGRIAREWLRKLVRRGR